MPLPSTGMAADDVINTLVGKQGGDVRWKDGRTFGMIYDGGPDLHDLQERVAAHFLHENALNTMAFPSLGQMQSESVSAVAEMLHGDTAAGFLTSGGTESILMAVKAARERGRKERNITEPNIVVADNAHAAFHKGAYYFGLEMRKTPVRSDWRADPEAFAGAVDDNTVLVVGSAPAYPQGVIDPIPELAAIAAEVGANFHTDACMGGFVLPFMESLGMEVPPWDFRVPGVTSISADLHKLGYVPKGVSCILHRDKELRRYQTFVFDGWLGGFYASPNMQGTRPGLPLALAWATLHFLGREGYERLTEATIRTARRMIEGIRAIDGVAVLGEPQAHLLAMATEPGWEDRVDVFKVGDALVERGWFHDRQAPPDSLHSTVSAGNAPVIEDYLVDLADAVAEVAGQRADDRSTNYATLE
ncbi:MAG: aspartate aminotransferase family protein [Acidimicrobiia bacterium]|nr:aspartate aminotransferase family protein [Acidimicrobiia bacterium]